eukprot:m.174978 g.174978  ORF g.174978 m.174978 type:complete len:1711 (-) comp14604_c0_seq1:328-5460(-)
MLRVPTGTSLCHLLACLVFAMVVVRVTHAEDATFCIYDDAGCTVNEQCGLATFDECYDSQQGFFILLTRVSETQVKVEGHLSGSCGGAILTETVTVGQCSTISQFGQTVHLRVQEPGSGTSTVTTTTTTDAEGTEGTAQPTTTVTRTTATTTTSTSSELDLAQFQIGMCAALQNQSFVSPPGRSLFDPVPSIIAGQLLTAFMGPVKQQLDALILEIEADWCGPVYDQGSAPTPLFHHTGSEFDSSVTTTNTSTEIKFDFGGDSTLKDSCQTLSFMLKGGNVDPLSITPPQFLVPVGTSTLSISTTVFSLVDGEAAVQLATFACDSTMEAILAPEVDLSCPSTSASSSRVLVFVTGDTITPSFPSMINISSAFPLTFVTVPNPTAISIGNATVSITATNILGSEKTCTFDVFVGERNPPTFVSCPTNYTVFLDESTHAIVNNTKAVWDFSFVDAVVPTLEPGLQITSTPTAGTTVPIGITKAVVTLEDTSGNTASCSLDIIAQLAPTFLEESPSASAISVNQGELVTFSCPITGYPAPSITWKTGTRSLGTTTSLALDDVTVADSGVYQCTATNDLGSLTAPQNVLLVVPAQPTCAQTDSNVASFESTLWNQANTLSRPQGSRQVSSAILNGPIKTTLAGEALETFVTDNTVMLLFEDRVDSVLLNGTVLWSSSFPASAPLTSKHSTATISDGVLIVTLNTSCILAMDVSSGEEQWMWCLNTDGNETLLTDFQLPCSSVWMDALYIVCASEGGSTVVLHSDAPTTKPTMSYRLENVDSTPAAWPPATARLSQRILFLFTDDGVAKSLQSVNLDTGETFAIHALDTNETAVYPPIFVASGVLVTTSVEMRRLPTNLAKTEWNQTLDYLPDAISASLDDSAVVLASPFGLQAYDLSTGKRNWGAPPTAPKTSVLVSRWASASADNTLLAVEIADTASDTDRNASRHTFNVVASQHMYQEFYHTDSYTQLISNVSSSRQYPRVFMHSSATQHVRTYPSNFGQSTVLETYSTCSTFDTLEASAVEAVNFDVRAQEPDGLGVTPTRYRAIINGYATQLTGTSPNLSVRRCLPGFRYSVQLAAIATLHDSRLQTTVVSNTISVQTESLTDEPPQGIGFVFVNVTLQGMSRTYFVTRYDTHLAYVSELCDSLETDVKKACRIFSAETSPALGVGSTLVRFMFVVSKDNLVPLRDAVVTSISSGEATRRLNAIDDIATVANLNPSAVESRLYQKPIETTTTAEPNPLSSNSTSLILIIVGSIVGALLIIGTLIVMWCRRRDAKQREIMEAMKLQRLGDTVMNVAFDPSGRMTSQTNTLVMMDSAAATPPPVPSTARPGHSFNPHSVPGPSQYEDPDDMLDDDDGLYADPDEQRRHPFAPKSSTMPRAPAPLPSGASAPSGTFARSGVQHTMAFSEPQTMGASTLLPGVTLNDFEKLCNIPEGDVVLDKQLGKGRFSSQYLGTYHSRTGTKPSLIWSFDVPVTSSATLAQRVVQAEPNAPLILGLEHNHLQQVFGLQPGKQPLLVAAAYPSGTLVRFFRMSGAVGVSTVLDFGAQVADGMTYLASQQVVHRNLQASQCHLSGQVVKISCAPMLHALAAGLKANPRDFEASPRWRAPETQQGKFSTASDVWSFGVLLWEMCHSCKQRPYANIPDDAAVLPAVTAGARLPSSPATPQDIYQLMMRCWSRQRTERISFSTLLSELRSQSHLAIQREMEQDSSI